jgi:hypothetical protein
MHIRVPVVRILIMTPRLLALLGLIVLPAVSKVRFEVASIRAIRPEAGPRDSRIRIVGDRLDVEAATVGDILDMLNEWRLTLGCELVRISRAS